MILMKLSRLLISATLGVATVLGLSAQQNIQDYTLKVDDFDELIVSDGICVDYYASTDSAGYIKYSCSPQMASRLIFTPNKAKLKIQVDDVDNRAIIDLPRITVMSSVLARVQNYGDSLVRVMALTPTSSLKLRVEGNGTIIANDIHTTSLNASTNYGAGRIILNGKAGKAKLSSLGTGTIEAGNLEAKQVSVRITGTGNVDCYATEKLSYSGSGSGKVYYKGDPEVKKSLALGIKVVKVE